MTLKLKNKKIGIKEFIHLIVSILSLNLAFGQNPEESKFKKQNIGGGAEWNYSEAVKISDFSELLFISGQVPITNQGKVPSNIKDQCTVAWSNVEAQLKEADMTLDNLVKVTFFVSDRKYLREVGQLREQNLLNIKPALTIVITGIYNENWLLEIEAIAAK
ncbi:RidA family protein [Seonamhaeicola aphaedonensis]|uniref:Enamine deaminase RidA (YjgF/YER057c/UK114 family) n=1 Tax=Seonamhaeicola aphaedonensis TaxID=1461338 RepID=A0A3D9HEV8_9FLAO|nr:RidA family protein [Seonamhaeicola aphaedonensis]RED47516.1 enamine deaminase RidA (YjgF/YER057c/UK114 family) [Seonamhaeicola aphaedonensis]